MKSFILAMLAIVAMFVAVSSADAHGGGVIVARDQFGRAVVVRDFGGVRSFHGGNVRGFNNGPTVIRVGPFGRVRSIR